MLDRNFEATAPNQKWVADITYIDTDALVVPGRGDRSIQPEGRGLVDRRPHEGAWSVKRPSGHYRSNPCFRGERKDLIHHSDRGSQYASGDFQRLLDDHGIVCSMSRKGNCWDNAVGESFFGTLKTELDEPFLTRSIAHAKLFDYIEVFYNRRRLHSTLNYMTPAAYEAMHQAA